MKRLLGLLSIIRRHLLFKAFVALSLGVIVCLVSYSRFGDSATAYITLNYPKAALGENMNGTRLNMYELKSDAVLEKAIERVGLTGRLHQAELASLISIKPSQTRTPEDAYIATEYTVSISGYERIGTVSAHDLLEMVCVTFVDHFIPAYAYNQAVLFYPLGDLSELDYGEVHQVFKTKTELLRKYLETRVNTSNGYVSAETGKTFSALLQQVNDFRGIVMEKFYAYVVNNGITKKLSALESVFAYKQRFLRLNYDKLMLQYTVRIEAISEYKTAQSAIVMIPTVDISNEFYMSKTKIGIDYLADAANDYMNRAKNMLTTINLNEKRLEYAREASGSNMSAEIKKAEEMITEMRYSLDAIQKSIVDTDNDYIVDELSRSLLCRMVNGADAKDFGLKNLLLVTVASFLLLSAIQWTLTRKGDNQRQVLGDA